MVWLRTVEQTKRIFHAYLASFVTSIIIVYPAISYLGTTGAGVSILVVTIVDLTTLAIGIRCSLISSLMRARSNGMPGLNRLYPFPETTSFSLSGRNWTPKSSRLATHAET